MSTKDDILAKYGVSATKVSASKDDILKKYGIGTHPVSEQTRAALPLPSVGVSEKEPTLLERVGKTLTAAGKGTVGDYTNLLGTLQDIDTRYREAKERMGDTSGTVSLGKEGYSVKLGGSKESDAKAKEIQTAADKLKESSAADAERAKQGLGRVGRFAVDLGVAGAQMAGDIALGALGGTGALAPMAARVFGGSAQEARQSGATLRQQLAYGAGSAALSVATEQIANTSKLMQKAFGKSTLASAVAKKFGDKGVTKAITEAVEKMQQTAAGRAAINAISEGGEEFIEDIFQPMLQRATYDKDAKFDLAGAIYDAAVGGALGAIGGIGERKALPLPGGTEAQETTQSEAERLRLKTYEEEAAMQKATSAGETEIKSKFKTDLDSWMKTTTPEQRAKDGGRFLIGHTSEQLKQADVDDYDIYFGKSKIAKILLNLEMTPQIIKEVADVVERPIIVMDSKTVPGSITMFGESKTGNGKPVMVSMLLHPINKTGEILDYGVVTSAYGRRTSNAQNLIDTSNIRYIDPDEKRTGDWMKTLGLQLPSASSVTSSIDSMPQSAGNVKGYNAVMPLPDEEINTGANQRSEQSEFDRIRIKSAEEEAAEREATAYEEEEALAAQSEANRQAQRMVPKDYEQQRRDLDEYWEMVGKQATMTREAPEKADTAELVTSEVKKEEKTFKESVKDLGATLRRKWIDSADAVSEIGKAVGDRALYPYFNMARASSNAALNMITTAQTNVKGETVGKSLNDIFEPIRAKGNDYYNLFQTYLFHRHNVDRMSRYSQENVNKAAAAMQTFKTNNPELLMYEQYQLEEMARDEWSDYNVEAKEYLRLLRELRKAENTKNKPVFGFGWGAEESRAEADKLMREHPEFETLAEDVYTYTRNLMQYRADSGLITEEQKRHIESIYPHYVPTFRWTEDTPMQRDERAVQIGSTIKQAKGGDQKLIPLHKALADQTMSVVREGSKNRFGQRLLSAERSKAEDAKKHLRHVEEAENGFSADTFDDAKDDFDKITNTFTVRSDGKRYDITVSEDLYEGIKALTPEQLSNNKFLKGARRANDLFKKLCTSMSPTFMIRNPIKDLQDAGLYSKDAKAFAAQFPRAAKEISTDGAYWQRYKALGGTYTSFFDYETGNMEKRSKLAEKTVGRIETLNDAIEQAPRLAEFMATVEKAGGLENASMDTLMQAMHNAADVTVNFGRSGTIARTVNRYVPFFNAGMQGLSKNVRLFTETKGAKDWTKLVTKCVILGVAPRLANEMLFGDRDDWDEIKDEVKDQNYLFPIGENKWLKIPKGRALSTFGLLGSATVTAMSGEEIDARYILSTAADNLAPANPLKNNIFAAAMDSDLFDPSSPGTTWYGGDIESQRLQNYAPGERYDAKTDEVSKWLGKTLGLSPKKINYILDQYTGFAGDVILPMMTTAAETSPFVNAFVVNSTTNNRLSGDFYDKLDELTFAKNGKDATGADAVAYRWFNKQSSAVSEINAAIREIEADATMSGEEKKELLEAQYKIRNAAEKSALDTLEQYADAAKFYYGAAAGDEDERVDDAYLRANREVFGAAYALQTYNKQVYEKAVEANVEGVDFDDYFDFYFATRGIEADKDTNGNSISGSKKEKVLAVVDAMDIPDEQKDALYLQQGYAETTISEAPWRGGKAKGLAKLPELKKLELPALELPR